MFISMFAVVFFACVCFTLQADSKGASGSKRGLPNTGGGSIRKIDSFFTKKPKLDKTNSTNTDANRCVVDDASPSTSAVHVEATETLDDENRCSSISNFDQSTQSKFSSDIGMYVGKGNLNDSTRAMLLEKHWQPPPNYVFPHCVVTKKGKPTKKYAQRSHLEKFHWLVLSDKDQGLYCKYCVLFATASGGGVQSNTPLKRLVKEPLKAFDDLLGENGVLLTHQRNQYHAMAVEAGKNFLLSFHKPQIDIVNQVSSQRMAQVNENRERLKPILKTIIFCGHQNVPLRGHRDDGKLSIESDKDSVVAEEGNFRALLKFRIESGDTILKHHLETSKANATYISKTVQNELIDVCKEIIQENILDNVKKAKYFAILFDETTDVSHISQLSLSFRYFYNGNIKEDFLTFCDNYEMLKCEGEENVTVKTEPRLTGVALAKIVENLCLKFNIDLNFCVGIGTDSCSVMASDAKGAVQELAKKAPHAKRCPCANHVLNNSLAKSSDVSSCRNTSGTMRKVVAFANASPKRHQIFEEELGSSVQGICETRWVERHDGHLQFQGDNLVKICSALEKISTWQDNKTASDAHCLLQTLRSSDFIITSICLCDVLGTTVSLSRLLQTSSIDLKRATDAINDTIKVLKDKREKAESVFKQLFEEAKEIAEKLDVEIKCPRIVNRQRHRATNLPTQCPEEYYRRSVYIPLLDSIMSDLNDRLSPEVMTLFKLGIFIPKNTSNEEENIANIKEIAQFYRILLDDTPVSVLINEYRLWVAKWQRLQNCIPPDIPNLILQCDEDLYPNIRRLLIILATLPVSVATAERSFSTLRRVKTWLRSTMSEDRLTGLALLNVHKTINIDVEETINRFARRHNRRIDFII